MNIWHPLTFTNYLFTKPIILMYTATIVWVNPTIGPFVLNVVYPTYHLLFFLPFTMAHETYQICFPCSRKWDTMLFLGLNNVMTLAFGSWPMQRHGKVQAKSATRKSHLHSQETGEWTHTLPSGLPLWELKALWSLESSKEVFQGSKLIGLQKFFIPLEISWNLDV